MAIGIGGHTITTGTTVASLTTAGVTTQSGSTFIAYATSGAAFGAGTVSDSFGNVYVHAANQTDVVIVAGKFFNVWTKQNGVGGAGHTFTCTPATSQTLVLGFAEISGAGVVSLDQNPAVSGPTSSATSTTPTATTTQPNELLFAIFAVSSNVTLSAPTAGFAILDQQLTGSIVTAGASTLVVSATGAYSTAVTLSVSHTWVAALLTFIAAGGQGAEPQAQPFGLGKLGVGRFFQRARQNYSDTVSTTAVTTISSIVGAYSWTGTTSTASGLINAGVGAYSWAGTTATTSELINAGIGAYSWAGTTATTSALINAGIGAYTWSGTTATASGLMNAGVGAYTWSAPTATLSQLINSDGGALAYSWAGTTSTASGLINSDGGALAYSWGGTTSTLGAGAIQGLPAVYTWAGTTANIPTQISSDGAPNGWVWSGTTADIPVIGGDTHDGGTQVVRESHYRKTLRLKKKGPVQRQDLIDEEIARLIADKPVVLNAVDDEDVITAYLTVESDEINQLTDIAGHLVSHLTRKH